MLNRYPTLIAVAALSCVHGAAADTIYLTDGTAIEDVGVQSEHLDQVAYKAGKKSTSVDADKVLFIEFSSKPQLVDSADANVAEELLLDALDDLSNFLDGLEASPRKWPWSRPYALFRLLEVHEILGELDKLVETADRLAELEPDSRYVPLAQLRKAQALYDSGKPEPAKASLAVFGRYIDDKGLSDRWRLGKELSEVLFDDASTGSATSNPDKAVC